MKQKVPDTFCVNLRVSQISLVRKKLRLRRLRVDGGRNRRGKKRPFSKLYLWTGPEICLIRVIGLMCPDIVSR